MRKGRKGQRKRCQKGWKGMGKKNKGQGKKG